MCSDSWGGQAAGSVFLSCTRTGTLAQPQDEAAPSPFPVNKAAHNTGILYAGSCCAGFPPGAPTELLYEPLPYGPSFGWNPVERVCRGRARIRSSICVDLTGELLTL